ncbi:hypothetical protein M0805_002770, partial [Coniferiporia weirii]
MTVLSFSSTRSDTRATRPRSSASKRFIFKKRKQLFRRKGGGGGGRSSSGGKTSTSAKSGGSSSSASKHGASSTFTKSSGAKPISVSNSGAKSTTANAYSDGGGSIVTLDSDSHFAGRLGGSGARDTVYGTSRFGSGYPYGGYGQYVDSRPLPYYFYPVPTTNNYYGGNEYLNATPDERPGGNLIVAIVQPSWGPGNVTYRILGDNSSVISVFAALVSNCSVVNATSEFYAYSASESIWPVPEQVVQYYRASSFLLSLDGYNNTASLPANMPASNNSASVSIADTPLPSSLNITFFECVNQTIGASVPLVDPPVPKKLSSSAIVGITFGAIFGLGFLICLLCVLSDRCKRYRKERRERKKKLLLKSISSPAGWDTKKTEPAWREEKSSPRFPEKAPGSPASHEALLASPVTSPGAFGGTSPMSSWHS